MTVENRLVALRALMASTNTDLVAVGPGPHMHWVLGFHPHPDERPCLLLISKTGAAFLMPILNAEGSRAETDLPFFTWSDSVGPDAALKDALKAINAENATLVSLDETMRSDFALLVLDQLPNAAHAFAGATIGALRMQKSEAEYEQLRMNSAIADAAMQKAFAAIKPGMTEKQVAAIVKAHFSDEGASTLFSIVGAGPNGAFPHHATGETIISSGDAVVIDIGARKGDFSSDITRMAIIGQEPAGYAEIHDIVERAVQAALKAARPGVKAMVVDQAARDVITEAGYGEYFVHRTSHGMGLEGHEGPYITSTSETVLEEGMVFSIEPGIYLPGRFGIRLEDIVILHADGPEVLSKLPRTAYIAKA